MSNFVDEASLMVAKSQSIITRLHEDYPRISDLLEYNRRATIGFLKANGALHGYTITHMFEVPYTGYDDGVKVWEDYRTEIEAYVEDLCRKLKTKDGKSYSEELYGARNALAEHIHEKYFNELPRWPDVGVVNKRKIYLSIGGTYESGAYYLVWNCMGYIEVIDRRPELRKYMAEFRGDPEIKLLIVDLDRLKELEKLVSYESLEFAKKMIDEKEQGRDQRSLTWEALK
ncbi:hypothetical protein RclHR1_00460014 [Rhizophagus clarus]|uniref:Uncharacterized protein n=1 Tax=Rhizophagus clarus TaxID=94130 RepID=A0A2Z6RIF0_9GLOM|nr:hypothetical protein RclHR1_00460014 [Rhizophagus clarus]GES73213.1 hypothetical protein GLOIN_2v1642902 [Rhizophagus clarus]